MRRTIILTCAAALACTVGACGDGGDAAPRVVAPAAQGIPEVVRRVEPSVVSVQVRGPRGTGEGSGVVWNRDGVIVTNAHVVDGAQDVQVTLASGEREEAEVVATDPLTDLAVLRTPRDDLPPARFARAVPAVGSSVIAIGNPLGFEGSVTAGIVSGVRRSLPSGGGTPALVDLLQTDAPISPGNSGGALVDRFGRVVGINVAHIPPAARAVAIGFAIPATTVVPVVEDLLRDGEVSHAYVGVELAPLTPEIAARLDVAAQDGAIVRAVGAGSPAARADLLPGDVIVAVAGTEIETVEEVYAAVRRREPGERLPVTIMRDDLRLDRDIVLGERPPDRP